MGSKKKLWRIMAGDHQQQKFRGLEPLARKIGSSIDYGHLEGRAAEIVGIVLVLALEDTLTDLQGSEAWFPDAVERYRAKCKWPNAAAIIAAAESNQLMINAEEAELHLRAARALMDLSMLDGIGIRFDWNEE